MTDITVSKFLLTKCAGFSARVYKTDIILRVFYHQGTHRTLSGCAIFSLRVYKTGIILWDFLPSKKTLHT